MLWKLISVFIKFNVTEEVAPQEVEETGPLYTDEELDALVRRVKDFTTLFDLREEDWTADVEAVIKSYFTDKKEERILCVYFENLTLSAAFEFPSTAVTDLTYFIKDTPDHITAETFGDMVSFGTTNDSVEGTILTVLEYVYAPLFFAETSWPDSILLP
ncbi:hypothetical protein C0J52_14259 [Blattella germanica]|nr:hypothetical protein C0J52_14259 [Blattella germanica]